MTWGEYEDQPDPVGTTPKAIVVAWWDEDITDLARSLSIFAPRGSVVKVISAEKPEVRGPPPCLDAPVFPPCCRAPAIFQVMTCRRRLPHGSIL